jgi:putative ABC transport system permease protein
MIMGVRMGMGFNSWLRDLAVSWRSLRQRPGFTVVAVVSLALGIGANALVFSVVNSVLLRPLSLPGADQLVTVWLTPPNEPDQRLGTNTGVFFAVRDNNTSFESFGTGRVSGAVIATPSGGDSAAQRIPAQFFSRDLIQTLGVAPLLGDWPPKDPNGICISYGLWQRMFGGSPSVLGTSVNFDGVSFVVDAVMPQGFQLLNPDTGVWIYQPDDDLARAAQSPSHLFTLIGRLKPGVTIPQAQAEMDGLAEVIGKQVPEYMGWRLKVESLRDAYVGGFRRLLWVFQGAVVFVLLIACSNVGALVLSRAAARRKELALRSALGSSRWRLVRQLLTDTLVLSLLGAALGIGLASVGVRVLVASGIEGFPRLDGVAMNWRVVAFAGLMAFGTGIVFGVLPGLYVSRPNPMEVLREASWGSSQGVGQQRFRKAFVVAQVALAVVILVAASLLLRSFALISEAGVGFNPLNLTVLELPFPRSYYRRDGRTAAGAPQVQFDSRFDENVEAIVRRLSALPGVLSVAATPTPPLGGSAPRVAVRLEGEALLPSEQNARSAEWYPISTDYFATLDIPLVRGRAFDTNDRLESRPVAIINTAMANRFWPGVDPIGQRFQSDEIDAPVREIVGVVGDVRQESYQRVPQPQMYIPRLQVPRRMDNTMALNFLATAVVVRTNAVVTGMNAALRAAVREVVADVPVSKIRTVEDYAAGQIQDLRRATLLLSTFGIIAVALALIGIFGVVSHLVTQRQIELGIRIALGAGGRNVQFLVLRQGVAMMILGVALGTGAALALTRLVKGLLYGVSATDPLSFAAGLFVLTTVGLLACYLPARRASRIEPVIALRNE